MSASAVGTLSLIERRAERRADAGGVDEILVRDRQAVQRTERAAARLLLVGLRRVGHRPVGDERDDRVDLRIDALDAREVRRHHLARRELLAPDARGELDGGEVAELVAATARASVALTGGVGCDVTPNDTSGRAPVNAAAPSICPKARRLRPSRGCIGHGVGDSRWGTHGKPARLRAAIHSDKAQPFYPPVKVDLVDSVGCSFRIIATSSICRFDSPLLAHSSFAMMRSSAVATDSLVPSKSTVRRRANSSTLNGRDFRTIRSIFHPGGEVDDVELRLVCGSLRWPRPRQRSTRPAAGNGRIAAPAVRQPL